MKLAKLITLCTMLLAGTLPEMSMADSANNHGFTFMQTLADAGFHDMDKEWWNAYGQATYISSWKSAFPAAYTNLNGSPNSLSANAEHSFTATVTFYLGLKAWQGGGNLFGAGNDLGTATVRFKRLGWRHSKL